MTSHIDLDAVIEAAARAEAERSWSPPWDAPTWGARDDTQRMYFRYKVRRAATAAAAETERQLRERWCRSGDYADGGS